MKHLRTRVFFQILFPVLAVYLVIIFGGFRYIGISVRENTLVQKKTALTNIVRGIDDWLLSRVSEVIQLSRIPLLKTGSIEEKAEYLILWRNTLAFRYDYLYLIEPNGSYRATDGRRGIVMEEVFFRRFLEEKAPFIYTGPYKYGSIFKDHFLIAVPIYDKDEKILHILAATIPRENLQKVFGYYAFVDFDSWMMVNPNSLIIAHSNPQMAGKSELEEYGEVFLNDHSLEDREVFVQIMRNGWKVVSFVERERIMAALHQVSALITLFSFFLFLVIIVVVTILSAAVARPVRLLTEGVDRIMAGDYRQRIRINTRDELSELAESFNRLASRMVTLRTDDRFAFLGHIAARMAHEMRKPLHVIQLAAQSLEVQWQERYMEIINQEVENANRFIREVLNFAHDDELEKIPYSLETLTKAVMEKFQLLAAPHKIALDCRVVPPIPTFYIDVIRMEEVLSNLIQNAMNAILEAEPPSRERRIQIDLWQTRDREIRLVIADSGPGFCEELMDRFFDPYFTTRSEGTGLGLALCYRVLMGHGGRITLENDENHHGRVVIHLPA